MATKAAPTTITVTSKQLIAELIRQKQAGQTPNFRVAAFALMPKGTKWFESGEDWGFALWLERMAIAVKETGKHKKGTYTFNEKKARF